MLRVNIANSNRRTFLKIKDQPASWKLEQFLNHKSYGNKFYRQENKKTNSGM